MKKLPFLALVLMAFAFAAHAQDASRKDAAKPAEPEVKVMLDSWNEIGRKLTRWPKIFPRTNMTGKYASWFYGVLSSPGSRLKSLPQFTIFFAR